MKKFDKGERCVLYDLGKRSIVTIVSPGVWIYTVKNSDDDDIDVHVLQLRKLKKKKPKIMWAYRDKLFAEPGKDIQKFVKVKVLE